MKILVVSPHRDDAAFSLGLSVEFWLGAGHRVEVLNCFTQSAYGPYSDAGSLHENDRTSFVSAVRRREDVAWNKLLGGRVQFHDLDLLDAPLRLACPLDEVFTVPIRPGDRALARVAGAIGKWVRQAGGRPAAVLLPLALGGHIDHRIVQAAGQEVAAAQAARTALALYEDLPYAARIAREEEMAEAAARVHAELWAVVPGAEAAVQAAVRRKVRMAECYDSQIDSAVAEEIGQFSMRYGGRDRVWADAAWAGLGLA